MEGGNTLGWVEREYGPGGSIKMSLVPISFPDLFLFFLAFFAPVCPPCYYTAPHFPIVFFEIRWLGIRIWDGGSGLSCAPGEADDELRTTEQTRMTSNSVFSIHLYTSCGLVNTVNR